MVVSSDNCGVDTITLSKDEFDLSNVGLNNVDITITDKSANSTTKTYEAQSLDADKDIFLITLSEMWIPMVMVIVTISISTQITMV